MEISEAVELIRGGVPQEGGTWADLGAGAGTFTRALARLLGDGGTVYAVDVRRGVLPEGSEPLGARIVPVAADFTEALTLEQLDGIVMANALHFVAARDQSQVLTRWVRMLRPGGTMVLVEYDQSGGNPWVPFPVRPERFAELASEVGLDTPKEIGRRRSRYGPKDIYAAVAHRTNS